MLLISSSVYAKRHINVCLGGDLCSQFFINFSETPCMKVGFDVKGFPSSDHEDRNWEIPFSFVFLDFTSTCGEQLFSHTKNKASEYEQLILASTPGKNLRRFRKDNNHLEKFDTY